MENTDQLTWAFELSSETWDLLLADAEGHPLQSALWGDARKKIDGIQYHRWAAFAGERLVWMVRFETRPIAKFLQGAWIPKRSACPQKVFDQFLSLLRGKGYLLCVEDLYDRRGGGRPAGMSLSRVRPKTIVIDLTRGKDNLLAALDKQWRYGVRAAERAGVVVEQSQSEEDVAQFFALCGQISKRKAFDLPGSERLIRELLVGGSAQTEARLFLARFEGCLAAGAVVLRCGKSLHYFWGGTDRAFSKQRPGEAVQWGVIEWALEQGLEGYDLEGIDPVNNHGVSAFKRKMGGGELELPGRFAHPLNLAGRIALRLGTLTGRI